MEKMLLNEVCAQLGISRRAVQGMEKAGLVQPSSKNKYGYLEYDDDAVETIRTIREYQSIGYKLSEIDWIMTADNHEKIESLTEKIALLEKSRERTDNAIALADSMIDALKK